MDIFLMICGACAVSLAVVYAALRLICFMEGRKW